MVMPGLVDYGAITVGGAIATGAHSSSLKHKSAVHDYMVAASVVNGLGQVIQVTDSDIDFPAFRANLGALGILVDITFKTLPLFKVQAWQIDITGYIDIPSWPDHIIELARWRDFANFYWFNVNNGAVMHAFDIVDKDTPGDRIRTTWDPAPLSIIPWVYYKAISVMNNLSENEVCLLAATRLAQLKLTETTEEGIK